MIDTPKLQRSLHRQVINGISTRQEAYVSACALLSLSHIVIIRRPRQQFDFKWYYIKLNIDLICLLKAQQKHSTISDFRGI
jgi:hypothetical protein